jgi:hypothetical protein
MFSSWQFEFNKNECGQSKIILFDVNTQCTAIWLADLPIENLVKLDNLGWYCDVTNIFIRQRQIQIVPWNNHN